MSLAPSKLIESEKGFEGRPCYYYSLLCSKEVTPHVLLSEILTRLHPRSNEINIRDEDDITSAKIGDKFQFFMQKVADSTYLLVYFNLSNISIKQALENVITKIKWLSFSWMSPRDLDSLEEHSENYDIITLYTSYDPYYLFKKFSRIDPKMLDKYQERWYKPRSVDVSVRTSKIDANLFLSNILKDKITETVKLKFKAKFPNPGEAGIVVDQNAKVIHEYGNLQATDKIINEVFLKTEEKIQEYQKYCTSREYKELEDGSFELQDYKMTRPFFYSLKTQMEKEELSVKLENLLTVSRKKLELYGLRLYRNGQNFTCHSYIPLDKSEFDVDFIADDEPKLIVDPLHISPLGILTLTKILSEKIGWETHLSGFYE